MKKTYFAILGAAAILSLATACSSKNVNEPTANESSQSASSESSSNGMDESSPMDDLKEDAKDAVLPSEGTADAKQSTLTGTISDIKDFMFTITADGTDYEFSFEQDQKPDGLSDVKDEHKVALRKWHEELQDKRGERASLRRSTTVNDVCLTDGFRLFLKNRQIKWQDEPEWRITALALIAAVSANVKWMPMYRM